MEGHLVFWFACKVIIHIIGCLIAYIVWKYITGKPLGQQTVLDKMIQDYIIINITNFFTSTFIYIKFSEQYTHEMAMYILAINLAGLMAWMLQIMATIGIRYLYIFYPGFMAETKDQKIILATRCFVGLGALTSVFLNDYGEGGPDYMYLTNSDSKTPQKSPTYWLTKVVLTLNVLLLMFSQVKIELFKKQTNPNGPTNNLNRRRNKYRSKNSIFGNKAVAITLVLLLAFLILFLDWAYFPTNVKNSGKTLRTRAIGSIIMQILFPLLWIRKNKNIQDFFFRMWFSKVIFPRPMNVKFIIRPTRIVVPMVLTED